MLKTILFSLLMTIGVNAYGMEGPENYVQEQKDETIRKYKINFIGYDDASKEWKEFVSNFTGEGPKILQQQGKYLETLQKIQSFLVKREMSALSTLLQSSQAFDRYLHQDFSISKQHQWVRCYKEQSLSLNWKTMLQISGWFMGNYERLLLLIPMDSLEEWSFLKDAAESFVTLYNNLSTKEKSSNETAKEIKDLFENFQHFTSIFAKNLLNSNANNPSAQKTIQAIKKYQNQDSFSKIVSGLLFNQYFDHINA